MNPETKIEIIDSITVNITIKTDTINFDREFEEVRVWAKKMIAVEQSIMNEPIKEEHVSDKY